MISGDLGAWHATMAQNQAQQDNPGGGLIIQAQEVFTGRNIRMLPALSGGRLKSNACQ